MRHGLLKPMQKRSQLDQELLDYFKILLEGQKEVLQNKKFPDTKDINELQIATNLHYSYSRIIEECKKALLRIKEKTFGICPKCKKNIEIGKLLVSPQGRKCQKCQQEENFEHQKNQKVGVRS